MHGSRPLIRGAKLTPGLKAEIRSKRRTSNPPNSTRDLPGLGTHRKP
jgi:hypothetical protein